MLKPMEKPVILITGANGQLGSELRALQQQFPDYRFIATDRHELPIQDAAAVNDWFHQHKPAYCINAAAYTAVDKAETDQEQAYAINANGTANLAAACATHGTKFIHVSTDYVFNGSSSQPYKETDPTDPINVYGASKLKGEELGLQQNPGTIIIRTAWVYSAFGNNFVKTMLRLMKERSSLNVVNDQIGAPTYAADLASAILHIIGKGNWQPGIYHYSNQGRISWYDFAVAIAKHSGSPCEVHPIPAAQYPTPAKRPSFSLLDTQKIRSTFELQIPQWEESLQRCLLQLNITV
jgi:dTDP-4-dehydrorhamnose reductase